MFVKRSSNVAAIATCYLLMVAFIGPRHRNGGGWMAAAAVTGAAEVRGRGAPLTFVREPPAQLDFSNSTGGRLDCEADGDPRPTSVVWTLSDGRPVTSVHSLRRTLDNGSLHFPPFAAQEYRQDVHAALYRCRAENSLGVIVSRDVRVRAVVLQIYEAQVYDEFVIKGNTAVLKCHIPTFVADYVTVTSWRQDDVTIYQESVAGLPSSKYAVMPTGELHVSDVEVGDAYTSYRCVTRHRLTGQVRPSAAAGRLFVTYPMGSVPPRITDSKVSVTITVGQTAVLPCVAQGYPLPEVTWFVKGADDGALVTIHSDGGSVTGSGKYVIEAGALRVLRASATAVYVCVANNTVGTERVETILHVTAPLSATVDPSRQVVDLGQPAVFRCVTSGTPIATLSWLRNGKPLFPPAHVEHRPTPMAVAQGHRGQGHDQHQPAQLQQQHRAREVLRLDRVERTDQGLYQCIVGSDTDSAQAVAQLVLGDVTPVLHYTFPETIVNPDAQVSLRCEASGSPAPHVHWTVDGLDLDNRKSAAMTTRTAEPTASGHVVSVLNISAVRVDDGGLYGCVAVNKAGRVAHSSRLNVYGRPFVRIMPKISAVASHDVSVTCPASGYPLASISFERGGRVLPASHHQVVFPNGTLYLKSVQRALDAGKYTCVVRNERGQVAQRDFEVIVLVAPHIIPFSFADDYVLEGTLARVSCVVGRGDRPLTLAWTKDGRSLDDDDGVTVRAFDELSSVLTVQSATSEHDGDYTCTATNSAGSTNHTARLLVNVPPRWVSEPRDVSVLAGDRVALHCRADGFPLPTIEWMKAVDNKPGEYKHPYVDAADDSVRHLDNGTLVLTATRPSDAGQYLCQASNGIGAPLGLVVNVHVQVPVHFESKLKNQTARLMDGVRLRCEANGEPPIHIDWLVNGLPLKCDTQSGYSCKNVPASASLTSEVNIARADRRDTATYVCAASNKYGRDEQTIRLTVVEPPESPSNLKASDKSGRTVTLIWVPPFDGNSPISKYVVQYKHAAASWHVGKTVNFTVTGTETTTTISYLQPADNYHVRILAINAIGSSKPSDIISVSTLEEVPAGPPLDIKVESVGNNVVRVTWKSPKRDLWNGRILGYYVGYRPHDSSSPYTFETVDVSSMQDVAGVNLTRLKKFTRYGIIVQAFNHVGSSPRSEEHVIVTFEDVPSSGPAVITCSPLSAQSLHVSWDAIPNEAANGILQGYKVLYRPVEEWYDESPEVKITSGSKTVLSGLAKYTNYSVQVMGFTRVGDGVRSSPTFCLTNEDVPEAPADVKAAAVSLTSSLVTWRQPSRPNGVVVKYTVYRRTTHNDKEAIEKYVVPANRLYYEASDLRKGDKYEFWVTASTSIGEGQSTRVVVVHASTGNTVPVKVMSFGDQLDVAWKSELVLPCQAVGVPTPQHDWTFGGKPVSASSRLSVENDWSLVIQGTLVTDSGVYSCRAHNGYGFDQIAYTVTIQVPPAPPTLTVSSASHRGLEVHWRQENRLGIVVTGFYLHYKRDFGEWQRYFVGVDQTTFSLKDLDCGSRYHLYMTAVNNIGEGSPGEVVTTKTEGHAPQMPRKHAFIRESSTHVTLHLDAWVSSCAILYFVVHYRTRTTTTDGDSIDWKLVSNNVLVQQKEFAIPDLLPATWYRLRVTAHNNAGSTVAEYDFATRTMTGDVLPEMSDAIDSSSTGGRGGSGSGSGGDGTEPPFYYNSATLAVSVACLVVSLVFVAVVCVACGRRTPRSSLEFTDPPHPDSRPRLSSETAKNVSTSSSNYLLNNGHRPYNNPPGGPVDITPTSDMSGDISPYATSQIPGCYAAHQHHAAVGTGSLSRTKHQQQQRTSSSSHVYPPLRDLQEVCDGTYPGARIKPTTVQKCSRPDRHFIEGYTMPLNSVVTVDPRVSMTRLPSSEYDFGPTTNSWNGGGGRRKSAAHIEHINEHAVAAGFEPSTYSDCSAASDDDEDDDDDDEDDEDRSPSRELQNRVGSRSEVMATSPRRSRSDIDAGTDIKETSFTFVPETKIGALSRIGADCEFSDTESERDILNRRKLFSPFGKLVEVQVSSKLSSMTANSGNVVSILSPWSH